MKYGSDCVFLSVGTLCSPNRCSLVNYVVVQMIQMLAPDKILERAYYNHVPTLNGIVLTPITSSRT